MNVDEVLEKIKPFGYETHERVEVETFQKFISKLPPKPTMLETGTCFGKSSCDWVLSGGGHVWTMEFTDRANIARNNIRSIGLENEITVIQCNSEAFNWNREVDVVWLDSDHGYTHLTKEINKYILWGKHLICGHDYGHKNFPGVKQAVDDYFGKVEVSGGIWYKWLKS